MGSSYGAALLRHQHRHATRAVPWSLSGRCKGLAHCDLQRPVRDLVVSLLGGFCITSREIQYSIQEQEAKGSYEPQPYYFEVRVFEYV